MAPSAQGLLSCPADSASKCCYGAALGVSTLAGSGTTGKVDGAGPSARFRSFFSAITSDPTSGTVYVVDSELSSTSHIRKVTQGGLVTTLAQLPATNVWGFWQVLAYDAVTSTFYTAHNQDCIIRKINLAGAATTWMGGACLAFSANANTLDGDGIAATFSQIRGLAIDPDGILWVADANKLRIITPQGNVSTAVSASCASRSTCFLTSLAVDFSSGWVYFFESVTCTIRIYAPATGATRVLAGSGTCQYADGKGVAASFNIQFGTMFLMRGTLYMADDTFGVLRTVSPSGLVSLFSGRVATFTERCFGENYCSKQRNYFPHADGAAADATFSQPRYVTGDGQGNVYVADNARIRKIGFGSGFSGKCGSGGVNCALASSGTSGGDGGQTCNPGLGYCDPPPTTTASACPSTSPSPTRSRTVSGSGSASPTLCRSSTTTATGSTTRSATPSPRVGTLTPKTTATSTRTATPTATSSATATSTSTATGTATLPPTPPPPLPRPGGGHGAHPPGLQGGCQWAGV